MNRVENLMSQPVTSCRPTDTLNSAASLLWEHDCGALPVVDEEGTIVGMITDRDICMALYTSGRSIQEMPVHDAMARKVLCCRTSDTLTSVEKIMADAQVRRLPVVDEKGRPVGIIALTDLARATESGGKRNALDVVSTLAAICRPRVRALARARAA